MAFDHDDTDSIFKQMKGTLVWAMQYFHGAILGIKRDGRNLRMVFFHPVKSVNKQLCRRYRYKLIGMQGSRELFERAKWKPQT